MASQIYDASGLSNPTDPGSIVLWADQMGRFLVRTSVPIPGLAEPDEHQIDMIDARLATDALADLRHHPHRQGPSQQPP